MERIQVKLVMVQVTISALKRNLSEYLRRTEAGEEIEVVDRTRPIARVVPIRRDHAGLEVLPASRSFASVRSVSARSLSVPLVSSSEALRHERGSR